ncbi:helix-turn-helix domain-containing protein [Streptomyces sp. NPDC127098]|uniref:helix-turn-helix domain-containing protein n=1 Tax=Streptomyces sp. NPDC127098 TaxID=3347137 RepID=UPI00364E0C9A
MRQQRLGAELRKLRERAGLTAREAGDLLSTAPTRINNIESGRFGISRDKVRAFAVNYGCDDEALISALADMCGGRGRNWWDEYRDLLPAGLLDLAEMEHHARMIRVAQVVHLPGLLQTVDYSRQVFQQSSYELSPPEVEFRVSHRIKRQKILYGDSPTPFHATIHEAALRMRFGGPEVTHDQLRHIVAMSELPHITVRVIPFIAGTFPGAGHTVELAEGPVAQLDSVSVDTEHGSVFPCSDAQLASYRRFMERFEAIALEPNASRDLILAIIDTP